MNSKGTNLRKRPPVKELQDLDVGIHQQLPLFQQIYNGIRCKILSGLLRPGVKLPSSRDLSKQLNISRNTVLQAFDQLITEGYLECKTGSGTFVAITLPESWLPTTHADGAHPTMPAPQIKLSDYARRVTQINMQQEKDSQTFCVGIPDLKAFPHKLWNRLCQQYPETGLTTLMGTGSPAGYFPLREAIAEYVRTSRSAQCEPHQVIITTGAQQALDLCARILINAGETAAIEEPGYMGARHTLLSVGAKLLTCPVDANGLILETLHRSTPPPKLLYVTPAHQYPMGAMMPLARRVELLNWASNKQCWIIEDDYDSEYHYQGRPTACLQGLSTQQQVIYIGSFSKVLFPSLRLGYLILPTPLVEVFSKAKQQTTGDIPLHTQAVTATFMQEGHFNRHIRRTRIIYAEKLNALLAAAKNLSPWCIAHAQGAGMHLTLEFKKGIKEQQVIEKLDQKNIVCSSLSHYFYGQKKKQGLVLGFTNSSLEEIGLGINKLRTILKSHSS